MDAAGVVQAAALLQRLRLPERDCCAGGTPGWNGINEAVTVRYRAVPRQQPTLRAPEIGRVRGVEESRLVDNQVRILQDVVPHRQQCHGASESGLLVVPWKHTARNNAPYRPAQEVDRPCDDDVVVQRDQKGGHRRRRSHTAEPWQAHPLPDAQGALAEHLPQSQLEDKEGQTQTRERTEVGNKEGPAAIGVAQVWKAPHIAQADSITHEGQDEFHLACILHSATLVRAGIIRRGVNRCGVHRRAGRS
mmetsp:Transcript_35615/g.102609  ORF Transcript_35615/g.102609 Transcript_35615/m.102609 type:complete len:248 (+) Transcript_35615:419-1162(+)